MRKPAYNQREVPPTMKEQIDLEFFRELTWKERFKILLGYNIRNRIVIQTQHCAGKISPSLKTEVVKDLQPQLAD